MLPDEKKVRKKKIEWLIPILLAFVFAILIRTFVFSTSIVEGESMEPTLENGEKVILNKLIYHFEKPNRGDVVIIKNDKEFYVKRIIGLPGEKIEVRHHVLYIDGIAQEENYIDFNALENTASFKEVNIPEESYFVMGDNRANSMDSRGDLGFILESNIVGRTDFIIYPFEKIARIH